MLLCIEKSFIHQVDTGRCYSREQSCLGKMVPEGLYCLSSPLQLLVAICSALPYSSEFLSHLKCCVQVWAPEHKTDMDLLE